MQSPFQFLGVLTQLDMVSVAIYGTIAFIGYVVLKALLMLFTLVSNKHVGGSSRDFPRTYNVYPGSESKKILIAGDSTAVGTGASSAQDTFAGRLAHDFPDAQIINIAKNGALTRNVIKQLRAVEHEHFDMILISAGGNDMWGFSSPKKLKRDLTALLQLAKKMTEQRRVFLLLYSDIGSAPLFPAFFRMLIARNCIAVERVFREVAVRENVPCIELFTENNPENPFVTASDRLFASDGIHPSSEGYRVWYNRFWRIMVEQGHHYALTHARHTLH